MDVKPLKIKDSKQTEGILHRSALLGKGSVRGACFGGSSSGKTYFACSIYPQLLHECIGGVYIFSKSLDQSNYRALTKYAESNDIPLIQDAELNAEYINEMMADPMPKYCMYDDMDSRDDNLDILLSIFKRGRHRSIFPLVISQGYKEINKSIRINLNCFIIFPMSDSDMIRSTLQAMRNFVSKEKLEMAYEFISQPENKYSCIFIANTDELRTYIIQPNGEEYNLINLQTMEYEDLRKNKGKEPVESEETEETEEIEE